MDEGYKCPVCGTAHSLDTLCPECGFEPHILLDQFDGPSSDYEERRVRQAREIWDRIQGRLQALDGREPAGFLVTSRTVVYVVDTGLNSYGSAKAGSGEGSARHRRVELPGVGTRPVHFTIEAVKGERRHDFYVSEAGNAAEGHTVFVNSMQHPAGERTELSDGDIIIVSDSSGAKDRITFRVNR